MCGFLYFSDGGTSRVKLLPLFFLFCSCSAPLTSLPPTHLYLRSHPRHYFGFIYLNQLSKISLENLKKRKTQFVESFYRRLPPVLRHSRTYPLYFSPSVKDSAAFCGINKSEHLKGSSLVHTQTFQFHELWLGLTYKQKIDK